MFFIYEDVLVALPFFQDPFDITDLLCAILCSGANESASNLSSGFNLMAVAKKLHLNYRGDGIPAIELISWIVGWI